MVVFEVVRHTQYSGNVCVCCALKRMVVRETRNLVKFIDFIRKLEGFPATSKTNVFFFSLFLTGKTPNHPSNNNSKLFVNC